MNAIVDVDGRLTRIVSRTDVSELTWYSVRVKDGIVTLEGTPETHPIGHKVLHQVRHVQGVVAVRDRLVYPLPPVPATPGPYF